MDASWRERFPNYNPSLQGAFLLLATKQSPFS